MEYDFSGHSNGKFPGITERLKRYSPVFPDGMFPTEILVPLRQTSSLIAVPDSLCKLGGFMQMVNETKGISQYGILVTNCPNSEPNDFPM